MTEGTGSLGGGTYSSEVYGGASRGTAVSGGADSREVEQYGAQVEVEEGAGCVDGALHLLQQEAQGGALKQSPVLPERGRERRREAL